MGNCKHDGEHMDWIHLAQDWLKWQAVVNTISGLWASTKCSEFLGWLRSCWIYEKGSDTDGWSI
jgi:hypothetical protein